MTEKRSITCFECFKSVVFAREEMIKTGLGLGLGLGLGVTPVGPLEFKLKTISRQKSIHNCVHLCSRSKDR